MYMPPAITVYQRVNPQGKWMAECSSTSHFLFLNRLGSCRDKVFCRPSMCELVSTVLGECSHPEVSPRALCIVPTKSNGIWHQVWSQASMMKPTPSSCEERRMKRGRYKPLLQYLSRWVIGVLPPATPDNHRTGSALTKWKASLISMELIYSYWPFR